MTMRPRRRLLFAFTLVVTAVLLFTLFKKYGDGHAVTYDPTRELELGVESQKALLDYSRALWDDDYDRANAIEIPNQLLAVGNPLILTLFSEKGVLLLDRREDDPQTNLQTKIQSAVANLKTEGIAKQRTVSKAGDGIALYLHIQVVSFTGRFPNFGIKGLFDNKVYEPRVTGLVYELNGKRAELDPLTALYRNLNSRLSRNRVSRDLGIDPSKMPSLSDLWIEIYRVIHFGESHPDRAFTQFHRGQKVLHAEDVTKETLMKSLRLVGTWYKHNVIDGQVTYQYGVNSEKYLNEKRTMVRSTMAVWILNRLATFLDDDKLRDLGRETMEYYYERYFNMKRSVKEGRILPSSRPLRNGNLVENRWSTAGFIAASALEREEYDKYKTEVDLLYKWLMLYQRDDGIFWTQFGQSQYFMPGQGLLTIAYIYEHTREKKYLEFFERSFDAYEQPLIAMMTLGSKRYAPFAPAWFTQPFTKIYELTKNTRYRDLVYMINDRVLKLYDLNALDIAYFDYDGILAPKPGYSGNNSITAASLESLVDAARVAQLDGDKERLLAYAKVIRRTVAYLLRLQYTPENTYYVRHRKRVLGGFKQDLFNNLVWCDNVWHLTSAFMKIYNYDLLAVTATLGD